MTKGRNGITRRGFIAGTLGTVACSADDEPGDPAKDAGTGGTGDPAAGGAANGGAASGGASGGGASGSGGTVTGGAPASGGSSGASTSGGASTGGATSTGGAGADSGSKVPVAIVAVTDVEQAVKRAIELAGGLDAIKPGQTVFIKPNAVSDRALGTPGIRTNPEVLAAVVKAVKARNPGRIVVGDRSARQFPDTAGIFERTGLGQAALAAGADEIYAGRSPATAPDEWVLMKPTGYEGTWGNAGGILAMRRIVEADHLINVPTCKDHRYALFSMSMKNFVGAIGDSSRDPLHFADTLGGNFASIGRDIAVFNQIFSPMLSVLDATTALLNGGPQGDGADAVRSSPRLVLASRDRVALDATGVSLIQHELQSASVPTPDPANPVLKRDKAWSLPQIVNAGTLGVGVTSADLVELRFDGVEAALAAGIEARFRA